LALDFNPPIPTKENFNLMLSFIKYLFSKYGNNFHYTLGPGETIDKNFDEFVKWIKNMYDEGKYKEINYGIWFDLDEKVLPEEYIQRIEK